MPNGYHRLKDVIPQHFEIIPKTERSEDHQLPRPPSMARPFVCCLVTEGRGPRVRTSCAAADGLARPVARNGGLRSQGKPPPLVRLCYKNDTGRQSQIGIIKIFSSVNWCAY